MSNPNSPFGNFRLTTQIPFFSGEHLDWWIYHVECYFYQYHIVPQQKLRVAEIYLLGEPLDWYHQWNREVRQRGFYMGTWEDFVRDLKVRFKPPERIIYPPDTLNSISNILKEMMQIMEGMMKKHSAYTSNLTKLKAEPYPESSSDISLKELTESKDVEEEHSKCELNISVESNLMTENIMDVALVEKCLNDDGYLEDVSLEYVVAKEDNFVREEKLSSKSRRSSKKICTQDVRRNAYEVMNLFLPPAKPPDEFVTAENETNAYYVSCYYTNQSLALSSIQGHKLSHWSSIKNEPRPSITFHQPPVVVYFDNNAKLYQSHSGEGDCSRDLVIGFCNRKIAVGFLQKCLHHSLRYQWRIASVIFRLKYVSLIFEHSSKEGMVVVRPLRIASVINVDVIACVLVLSKGLRSYRLELHIYGNINCWIRAKNTSRHKMKGVWRHFCVWSIFWALDIMSAREVSKCVVFLYASVLRSYSSKHIRYRQCELCYRGTKWFWFAIKERKIRYKNCGAHLNVIIMGGSTTAPKVDIYLILTRRVTCFRHVDGCIVVQQKVRGGFQGTMISPQGMIKPCWVVFTKGLINCCFKRATENHMLFLFWELHSNTLLTDINDSTFRRVYKRKKTIQYVLFSLSRPTEVANLEDVISSLMAVAQLDINHGNRQDVLTSDENEVYVNDCMYGASDEKEHSYVACRNKLSKFYKDVHLVAMREVRSIIKLAKLFDATKNINCNLLLKLANANPMVTRFLLKLYGEDYFENATLVVAENLSSVFILHVSLNIVITLVDFVVALLAADHVILQWRQYLLGWFHMARPPEGPELVDLEDKVSFKGEGMIRSYYKLITLINSNMHHV